MYAAAFMPETSGYELLVEQQILEDLAVSIAEGTIETENVSLWFKEHTRET